MQDLVNIASFLKDSANGVYYTLIQFWPFTVLFGLFLIFICLDFFIAGISHLKIIPIKPIKPLILRPFNFVKFRSVNPVHFGQLKPIKMNPLVSKFNYRFLFRNFRNKFFSSKFYYPKYKTPYIKNRSYTVRKNVDFSKFNKVGYDRKNRKKLDIKRED